MTAHDAAARVLVVEDDPALASVISRALGERGHEVAIEARGDSGLQAAIDGSFDIVVLDVVVPGIDGIEVCRRLKRDERTARLPVIMLTARQEPVDRIVGLELGADDYITKPFNLRELVLRVGAVLRRSRGERGRSKVLGFAGLRLDPAARIVTFDGAEVHLTGREFDLLHFLLTNPNRVFSRSDLLRQVWDYDFEGYDRTVDAHVARLRRKLGPPGEWIETAWGVGYKLHPPAR
jgi:two-component system phosphate regulon response regulator PhoB